MSVRIAQTDDLAACLALRHEVFVQEQGVPEEEEVDALDATAIHLAATDNARTIGTARIVLTGTTAKIGRVCVARSHRGTGLGAALIRACLNEARRRGATRAKLGAQVVATGFYQRLGFVVTSGEYDDAGIAHVDMERPL